MESKREVVGIYAENYGFLEAIATSSEVVADPFRYPACALVDDQGAIEILLVVDAIIYFIATVIHFTPLWAVALHVYIQVDADHLVGSKEAVSDALLERIGIARFAKIMNVGYIFCFFRRCSQTDLGGIRKILQDLSPGRIFCCAATMALIHHNQIKEAR